MRRVTRRWTRRFERALAAFRARSGSAGQPDDGELRAGLDAGLAAIRRRWPEAPLDAEAFGAHLAAVAHTGGRPVPLPKLALDDVFFAWRCGSGDPWAIAAFERELMPTIEGVVAKHRATLGLDDARQLVREKVLVGSATLPPALLQYTGRAPLVAWLRLTAQRTLIDASRRHWAPPPDATPPEIAGRDEELRRLSRLYSDEFARAVTAALQGLADRERTLLRQAFVHGLSARQLAGLYRVHHATAARWVSRARDVLAAATRAELRRTLALDERELDSVFELVDSQLHVSVARILGDDGQC